MAGKLPRLVACVYCNGGLRNHDCKYGCIGCEACVNACKKDAIHLNGAGVAAVDVEKCVGCGLCIKACPQNIIHKRWADNHYAPLCSNEAKGADAKKQCDGSCISCGLCVKKCPSEAVSIEQGYAMINDEKCLDCGFCAVNCPRKVIVDTSGLLHL